MYTLVTGATSDIGKKICEVLAEAGHKLLLSDLSEDALQEVVSELPASAIHKYFAVDLSNYDEAKSALENYIKANSIQVCAVVFAAGIFSVKPLRVVDYSYLKKSFDIAIFSMFGLLQVLSSKKINGTALKNVLMISSISAKMGTRGYTVYGSLKSSMLGMMRSLAVELAPNTRVNAVLPGGIRTKTTNFIYENMDGPNPRYLLGDGKPIDIAKVIKFLLSDDANWMTGQEIIVDGGLSIN